MAQNEHRVPIELRRYSDYFRCVCRRSRKNKNLGPRSLQDRYVRVQMLICDIVRDIDPDHTGDVTEPVFQPLDYFLIDLIVLPKSYNPASGVGRLYVVGVDTPSSRNEGCQPIVHGNNDGSLR